MHCWFLGWLWWDPSDQMQSAFKLAKQTFYTRKKGQMRSVYSSKDGYGVWWFGTAWSRGFFSNKPFIYYVYTRKLHRWKTLRHYAIGWREQKLNDWVNKKAVEWFWRMIWVWFSKSLFCLCVFFHFVFQHFFSQIKYT